jgi:hypothetical protein
MTDLIIPWFSSNWTEQMVRYLKEQKDRFASSAAWLFWIERKTLAICDSWMDAGKTSAPLYVLEQVARDAEGVSPQDLADWKVRTAEMVEIWAANSDI